MKEDLSYHRKSYEKKSMKFDDLKENPIEQFRDWFLEAEACDGVDEANVILPIGNLLIAIFIMHVMDKQFVKKELLQGSKMGEGFYKTYRFLMTFVVPTVIVVVLGYLVFQY